MSLRFILMMTLMLSDALHVVAADHQPSLNDQRRFLLTGMRAEREKLRSGQVVITGEHWRTSRVLGEFRISVRFDIAFDHDSRSYRYTQRDYEQYIATEMTPQDKLAAMEPIDQPHGTTPEGIEWITEKNGGTVVQTPEYDLHRAIDSDSVTRLPPGMSGITAVREWDLAALGLMDWPLFDAQHHLIDILNDYEMGLTCHSISIDSSGLSSLRLRSDWNPRSDSVEYEIWIDEKHGMTPVRFSRKDLNDSLKEISRSDVGWRDIHGVMVPVSFRINMLHNSGNTEGYDLTLEWSHVNEPLDPKIFTPAGITESDKALVADLRLGKIIVERVHPLPVATPKPVKPKPPSRLGWIVLGHLIAGSIFAWWYYRRKARRQSV